MPTPTPEELLQKINRLEEELAQQTEKTEQTLEQSRRAAEFAMHAYRVDHYGFIWVWDIDAKDYKKTNMRVMNPVIADKALQSRHIADNAVEGRHMQDNAVTTEKIGDGEVKSRNIAPEAITTDKIEDKAITTPKIAPKAVTRDKLDDHAVPELLSLIDEFVDAVRNQVKNYKPITIHGDVKNAPDEEDLTSVGGLLKLKDRSGLYGYGMRILRKEKTFASQVTQTRCIYVVQYDFDLDGSSVTMPADSIILFYGGRITNGTLVGSKTHGLGEAASGAFGIMLCSALYYDYGNYTLEGDCTDETSRNLQAQIDTLNGDSSTSGSVAKAVADAKTELIGGATSNGNTLKKMEDRTAILEAAVGFNGSVDQRIAAAVNVEKTRAKGAESILDGRVNTLEEAVGTGGSIDSRISSAVNAAKSEIKGTATSACDTLGEAEALIGANTTAIVNEATARANAVSVEASRAQAAEELLQEQYNALTQSDIVIGTLPASGTKNLIYRVPGTNSYSDYMWNGTQFVKMAEYDNAIDDEPTPGSDNMLKSGGAAKFYGTYKYNNQGFIDAVTDKKGRVLLGFYKNGDVIISGMDLKYWKDALNRIEMLTDSAGKILSYRTKDGTLVEHGIKSQALSTEDINLGEKGKEYIRNLSGGAASSDVLTDPDDWEIPQNNSNKLAVVRSDGMTRLTWIPKKDVPTLNGNVRQAGNLVHGIPYGATYEEDKCVGFDVSIETFMTAVNNQYSLLYTERCGKESLSSSIWGKTYHGINGYTGPYFGSVCSEFTSYCLGLNSKTYTGDLKGFNRNASMGKVHPISSQGVRVGDIYYKNGHCTLIKAVKRNEVGTVVAIIVAEQNGTTYETLYTAGEFDEMIATDMESRPPVVIYRDISLERGTDISTFDGDNYQYNNDICTFAGDKACFRENELIVINYNLENNPSHDWTAIELYKNDALLAVYQISDIDQAELPEGQRGHAIKFADGLPYGRYKARLTNSSSFSDYTSFDVIQTNVNVSGIQNEGFIDCGNVLDVSFSSMNARPIAIKLSMYSGSIQRAFYNFADYEITNGRAVIDVNYFIEQQKDREGGIKPNTLYGVRIVFETAYGRVTNKDINIKFNY